MRCVDLFSGRLGNLKTWCHFFLLIRSMYLCALCLLSLMIPIRRRRKDSGDGGGEERKKYDSLSFISHNVAFAEERISKFEKFLF